MGGNQSKTSERRRKKEDLESGGREKTKLLTALFSSQKVKNKSSIEGLPEEFQRGKKSQSFRKKLKKNWTNWAAQRGLIDPCRGEHTCSSHSQAPTKPSSVVLARKEQKKLVEVLVEEEEEEIIEVGNKELIQCQAVTVTSVVVEQVNEGDQSKKELFSSKAILDPSPLQVCRKPKSPLDSDTGEFGDTVAAEELIKKEIEVVQSTETPDLEKDESAEDRSCEPSEEINITNEQQDSSEEGGSTSEEQVGLGMESRVAGEEVIEEEELSREVEESEGSSRERRSDLEQSSLEDEEEENRKCRQEACLVHHQPDIVTDAEKDNVDVEESIVDAEEETNNIKGFSSVKSDAVECEVSVPNEIVEELIGNVIGSTDPEPSKLTDNLEENTGGWDEEETWEDYDSEFDLEENSRIPAYVDFEIGVWSSALWTSDMKWEKQAVEEEEEKEEVGWGAPFDHFTNASSNCTWSTSSSSGDDATGKDTFDESDFCDSPVNSVDDSVSTDEGIVASDDEASEKALVMKKAVFSDNCNPAAPIEVA